MSSIRAVLKKIQINDLNDIRFDRRITEKEWESVPTHDREAILAEAARWSRDKQGVWRRAVDQQKGVLDGETAKTPSQQAGVKLPVQVR